VHALGHVSCLKILVPALLYISGIDEAMQFKIHIDIRYSNGEKHRNGSKTANENIQNSSL